jgi:protein SCO1/2
MFPMKKASVALLASLAIAFPAAAAEDHSHHQHPAPAAGEPDPHAAHREAAAKPVTAQSVQIKLTDVELTDQFGKPVKLKSDLVGDRIVVMDFVYTTCTTVCPVLSALLKEVQGKLAADGKETALVSVSVDPVRDTPQRLKAFAEKYKAGPGWSFVTGKKLQVEDVLKMFGAYTPNFVDHPPLVMVGDGKTGRWLRFFGFPSPDQIVAAVNDLRAARGGKAG